MNDVKRPKKVRLPSSSRMGRSRWVLCPVCNSRQTSSRTGKLWPHSPPKTLVPCPGAGQVGTPCDCGGQPRKET